MEDRIMTLLEFIFSSFWIWLGLMVILTTFFYWTYALYSRYLRHRLLKKLGYPPKHCNVDGDLLHDNPFEN